MSKLDNCYYSLNIPSLFHINTSLLHSLTNNIVKSLIKKKITTPDIFFELSFVDKKTITTLNKKYRRINKETDVLSFYFPTIVNVKKKRLLGEIFINFTLCKTNLKLIKLLIIHGLLHLLGFDHDNKKNKNKMWKIQKQLLIENN